jgi:hypothetical protein
MAPNIPILVGVGDIVNRSTSIADAREPLILMLDAIQTALADVGLPQSKQQQFQSSIDSIDVVRTWTWPYDNLPSLIAQKLNIRPKHQFYTEHGGNKPAKMLDEAARRISQGEAKVAVVTGGEALASCKLRVQVNGWSRKADCMGPLTSNGMCQSQETSTAWLDKTKRRCDKGLLRYWKRFGDEYGPATPHFLSVIDSA